MYKKLILILNLIFILFLLTSCISGNELEELGIVVAIGVDREDGKVIITNEVIDPSTQENSKSANTDDSTVFVQGMGNTIEEAVVDIRTTFDRELYYAHNYVVIIGEEVAKEGFGSYMDVLTRSDEQREKAYLVIAKELNAYEIMGGRRGIGASSGQNIEHIIEKEIKNGRGVSMTIYKFFKEHYKENQGIILDTASIVRKPEVDKSKTGSDFEVICIEGGSVVNGDQLIGHLTGDEMLGFNFIQGDVSSGIVSFKLPEKFVEDNQHTNIDSKESSFRVLKTKTTKELKIIDGKLYLHIDVVTRGDLTEVNQSLDISQLEVSNEIEEVCAKEIESMISRTIDKAQKEINKDIFDLGSLFHRKYPKLWKEYKDNWDNIFENLNYTVDVEVKIPDTGLTNAPPSIRKEK